MTGQERPFVSMVSCYLSAPDGMCARNSSFVGYEATFEFHSMSLLLLIAVTFYNNVTC